MIIPGYKVFFQIFSDTLPLMFFCLTSYNLAGPIGPVNFIIFLKSNTVSRTQVFIPYQKRAVCLAASLLME